MTAFISTLALLLLDGPHAAGARPDRTGAPTALTEPALGQSALDETALGVQTAQQAADLGAANAATQDVEQSIAVIDRTTGELVAAHDGDRVFNAESILKPFTAAYYLLEANGSPDPELVAALRTMIQVSDDGIQSALWDYDIIPTIAERYGLSNTNNGPNTSSASWGSDRTTAADLAKFLLLMSQDPLVGPFLMPWMASTAPTGADGFNQAFGFNILTGDHGSKQGWSDPDWSPANLHSIGWTDRYFAAVLQNSPTASYATMRATSTHTVKMIASVARSAQAGVGILQDAPDRFGTLLEEVDAACIGRQLGRTLRSNHAIQLFGIGRLVGDILPVDDGQC